MKDFHFIMRHFHHSHFICRIVDVVCVQDWNRSIFRGTERDLVFLICIRAALSGFVLESLPDLCYRERNIYISVYWIPICLTSYYLCFFINPVPYLCWFFPKIIRRYLTPYYVYLLIFECIFPTIIWKSNIYRYPAFNINNHVIWFPVV